mgnify:CR=1 FL=1
MLADQMDHCLLLLRLSGKIVDRILSDMKDTFAQFAKDSCFKTLAEMKNCVETVSQKPITVREFTNFVDANKKLEDTHPIVQRSTDNVEHMYLVLDKYDVKISTDASVQLDELRAIQKTFADERAVSIQYKSAKLPEMRRTLGNHIVRLGVKQRIHEAEDN